MSAFLQLPSELYQLLFEYFNIIDILFFYKINVKFNRLIKDKYQKLSLEDVKYYLIKFGYLDLIIYHINRGYIFDLSHFYQAAECDRLDIVKYLYNHANNSRRNKSSQVLCCYAAGNGNLEMLKCFHSLGYPWHEWTSLQAAEYGHLECLQYMHQNKCKWYIYACHEAAKNGHLECLKYLHENGCPWDDQTAGWATCFGHMDCLKYIVTNHCPLSLTSISFAIQQDQLECVKYLVNNNCPYDIESLRIAEHCQANKCTEYLKLLLQTN